MAQRTFNESLKDLASAVADAQDILSWAKDVRAWMRNNEPWAGDGSCIFCGCYEYGETRQHTGDCLWQRAQA